MYSEPLADALVEALELTAPGTTLREGMENIIRAKTGALLVIGVEAEISFLFSGGLRLDTELTPPLLYELAKMDGAIILNRGVTKIKHANVQLMPDAAISTSETGTRHRTAERVAKQTGVICISISQLRDIVTIFVGPHRYILGDLRVLLAKANQALQTLERYRARLDQISGNLTALEFEGASTVQDVLLVLQRAEMVTRIAREIRRYLIELGTEGRLVEMQLEELIGGVAEEREALVKDYVHDYSARSEEVLETLSRIHLDDLIELESLSEVLGHESSGAALNEHITPRGYRLLRKVPRISNALVHRLVERFGNIDALLTTSEKDLADLEGVGEARAREVIGGLGRLKEMSYLESYV